MLILTLADVKKGTWCSKNDTSLGENDQIAHNANSWIIK